VSKTNANIDMSMNTNASILKCVTNTCTSSESTTDANVVLYFMSTNTCTFTSTDPILILGAVARSHFLWWISLWTGGDFCVGSSVESHLEGLFFSLLFILIICYLFFSFLPLVLLVINIHWNHQKKISIFFRKLIAGLSQATFIIFVGTKYSHIRGTLPLSPSDRGCGGFWFESWS
jgi:hypothetical protein